MFDDDEVRYGDLRYFIELFSKNVWYRRQSPLVPYENDYYGIKYQVECKNIPVYSFRMRQCFSQSELNQLKNALTSENTLA